MKVDNFIPTDLLKPFIDSYTIIENDSEFETVVLPHYGLVLAIKFMGQVLLSDTGKTEIIPSLTLSGMRKSFRKFNYKKNTGMILVMFKVTGALPFFKYPLHELYEEYQSLDCFFRQSEIDNFQDKLSTSKNNFQRIEMVEDFLIPKLSFSESDKLIDTAIRDIFYSKGTKRIGKLYLGYGISQDAFEKRFRKNVGASAKQFSTTVRLKSVVELEQQSKPLTDIAYKYEFFDQAHFIKDFKLFTGQSPKEFFKSSYQW